ncbi:hypothetical protein B1964_07035 [Gordonia sp. i37]|nr:hypothetical protein B1964_07035 [Gordonia sp. i37]
MVYETTKAIAAADDWSANVAVVAVGGRRRQAATALGSTSVAVVPMRHASVVDLRGSFEAFQGGLLVLDDLTTTSRHLQLTRPSRSVADDFEELVLSAQEVGTAIIAIGRYDAAGRPMGGALWDALRTATIRLKPESDTPLGDFRVVTDYEAYSPVASATHGAVSRSVCIDRSGVSLTDLPDRPVVHVSVE